MAMKLGTAIAIALGLTSTTWAQNTSSLAIDPLQNPYPFSFPPINQTDTEYLFPMRKCHNFSLEEATIDQLQEQMRNGGLTAAKLLRCYLKRVQQVDEYINSVMELNPDAEDIAQALDAERAAGRVRGPLHGIPFLVKDNVMDDISYSTHEEENALLILDRR